jgi:hypothetical protein
LKARGCGSAAAPAEVAHRLIDRPPACAIFCLIFSRIPDIP